MKKTPEELLAKKKKIETHSIHINLELPLYKQLEGRAEEEGIFPGQLVRCAIYHYLECDRV